ncbi:hypothetical protein V9T40_008268 [Parthenolecanium corni]|uniref:Uncharacterized protein n=1 Tax=Parthenolecanium corni TaxID=536013 RepID=A0AAN9Y7P9_9HEMI
MVRPHCSFSVFPLLAENWPLATARCLLPDVRSVQTTTTPKSEAIIKAEKNHHAEFEATDVPSKTCLKS